MKITNFSPYEIRHFIQNSRRYSRINGLLEGERKTLLFFYFLMLFYDACSIYHWRIVGLFSFFKKIHTDTFQPMIDRYVNIFFIWSNKYLIQRLNDYYPIRTLIEEKVFFEFHPKARYATNVIFQQSNLPAGNISENKRHFSEKHHIYEIKSEVSVLPNGISIGCSDAFPGPETDTLIFRKKINWHISVAKKDESYGSSLLYGGELCKHFSHSWAILADWCYAGLAKEIRIIICKKKTGKWVLSHAKKNKKSLHFTRQRAG